jgi:two-component system NtrC family response regulator
LAESRYEPTLFPKHLPSQIRVKVARAAVAKEPSADAHGGNGNGERAAARTLPRLHDFRQTAIEEAEKYYLFDLMSLTGGNVPEACRIAELSPPRLYALLKKNRISRRP